MDAIECIKTRRSIRKHTDEVISKEVIQKIMEATVYAPSWKNTQIVRYTIVTESEKIEEIAEGAVLGFAYNTKTIGRSKVLAVQSIVTGISGYEPDGSYSTPKGNGWEMYDAGISAQTFCLAAHSYGVGTVIMGVVDDSRIAKILGIPEEETITTVIAMGYPVAANDAPPRKAISEVVRGL